MNATLESMCAETRNWFEYDKRIGHYEIKDGDITLPFLANNQYFRIVGSKFNDGIYKYNDTSNSFANEEFDGGIWLMSIPKAFLDIAKEVKEYNASDMAKATPYISESFGGYSYSKGVGSTGNADNSWQKVFASKLHRFRKVGNIC